MKRKIRGTVTIEAAVIVPLILFVFVLLLHFLFYAHDRNVISAAAYETVAVASGREAWEEEQLEEYFQKRIRGRMWFFSRVQGNVSIVGDGVKIKCQAQEKKIKITIERKMQKTDPEDHIRSMRKFYKLENLWEGK